MVLGGIAQFFTPSLYVLPSTVSLVLVLGSNSGSSSSRASRVTRSSALTDAWAAGRTLTDRASSSASTSSSLVWVRSRRPRSSLAPALSLTEPPLSSHLQRPQASSFRSLPRSRATRPSCSPSSAAACVRSPLKRPAPLRSPLRPARSPAPNLPALPVPLSVPRG